jgi:hypothetical protein
MTTRKSDCDWAIYSMVLCRKNNGYHHRYCRRPSSRKFKKSKADRYPYNKMRHKVWLRNEQQKKNRAVINQTCIFL